MLLTQLAFTAGAFGDSPSERVRDKRKVKPPQKYVMVTGSHIPQAVKVKSIGTATTSPLRVIERKEIDKSGRFTTKDVLADDPSIRTFGH